MYIFAFLFFRKNPIFRHPPKQGGDTGNFCACGKKKNRKDIKNLCVNREGFFCSFHIPHRISLIRLIQFPCMEDRRSSFPPSRHIYISYIISTQWAIIVYLFAMSAEYAIHNRPPWLVPPGEAMWKEENSHIVWGGKLPRKENLPSESPIIRFGWFHVVEHLSRDLRKCFRMENQIQTLAAQTHLSD